MESPAPLCILQNLHLTSRLGTNLFKFHMSLEEWVVIARLCPWAEVNQDSGRTSFFWWSVFQTWIMSPHVLLSLRVERPTSLRHSKYVLLLRPDTILTALSCTASSTWMSARQYNLLWKSLKCRLYAYNELQELSQAFIRQMNLETVVGMVVGLNLLWCWGADWKGLQTSCWYFCWCWCTPDSI